MQMSYSKSNFRPRLGDTFETKAIDGHPIVHESVSFVPDITIECTPPYIKGKADGCWVKYRKGNRPTDKEGWQSIIGMSIQTML
jgi:hypothetical protein